MSTLIVTTAWEELCPAEPWDTLLLYERLNYSVYVSLQVLLVLLKQSWKHSKKSCGNAFVVMVACVFEVAERARWHLSLNTADRCGPCVVCPAERIRAGLSAMTWSPSYFLFCVLLPTGLCGWNNTAAVSAFRVVRRLSGSYVSSRAPRLHDHKRPDTLD